MAPGPHWLSMDCDNLVRRNDDLPRSAESVLSALCEEGPLTMSDLQARCGLARRTVYGAVRRLRERGLLQAQTSLRDTRQTFFWLRPRDPAG